MRRSFNSGKGPSFQKIVISSFVIHLIFIAVTAVPLVHKKREIKPYYVNLVNPVAIHRPETVSSTVSAKKDKAVTITKKKVPITKNVKQKAKMVVKPDKADNAIDKIKEKKAEDKKKLDDLRSRIKSAAEKAAEKEEASDPYAGMGASEAYLLYTDQVADIINSYWNIPGIDVEGLEAVFDIKVDKNWKIISFKIKEASNNMLFVRSVYKAMQDAQEGTKLVPLPEPPSDMIEEVLEDGFIFRFKPEK